MTAPSPAGGGGTAAASRYGRRRDTAPRRRALSVGALAGLSASATALALAPLLMPAGYSWVSHTTSESAAQGVGGAWLARLGFVLFGLSVLVVVVLRRGIWTIAGTVLHASFGVFMVAAAAFSTRPWADAASFDRTEDTLHSVAATAMGFVFAVGVVSVLVGAGTSSRGRRALGLAAVAMAVVVPLGMSVWADAEGLLQRLMFAVAYLWYGSEAADRSTGAAPIRSGGRRS